MKECMTGHDDSPVQAMNLTLVSKFFLAQPVTVTGMNDASKATAHRVVLGSLAAGLHEESGMYSENFPDSAGDTPNCSVAC